MINAIPAAAAADKLSFREKFSYSLGNLGTNLLWTAISTFIVYFYTDIAGIAAATVGVLILVSRIFDGASDVFMGLLVDRTKTRFGKARPFILWMSVPFAVSMALLFTAPDFSMIGKIVYAFITYNVATTIIYTSIDIPYQSLTSLLTQDQYQRSLINIFRLFMAVIAGVIVNMSVLRLVDGFGGGAKGWQLTFVIFGGISLLLFLITFFNTKERVISQQTVKSEKIPVKKALKALWKNKYWKILVVFAILSYVSTGLGSSTVYYTQYILGDKNLVGTLTAFGAVPMLIGTFILAPFVKRYGKRNVAMAGCVCAILGHIIMALSGTNLIIIFVATFFKSLGGAAVIGTLFALIADTVEYGEWKSGIRSEGLVFSAVSFGGKLGNGLGAAIVGIVLSIGGYIAQAEVQTPMALASMKVLFIFLPLALSIGMLLLLIPYKLDKEYPAILEELNSRKQSGEGSVAEQNPVA
jgi:GPH family glycoside/pentoside/hexuronide:cation symporter